MQTSQDSRIKNMETASFYSHLVKSSTEAVETTQGDVTNN
jgi:hypothetical protein